MLKTKFFSFAATLLTILSVNASAHAEMSDTKFAVDGIMINPVSHAAYIEKNGAQGTHKFFIDFYAFPMTSEEEKEAALGNKDIVRSKMPSTQDVDAYNRSNATLVVTVSADYKTIYQVDMAIPGYTCTVAQYTDKAPDFAKSYSYDGTTIHLESKGSYACFNDKHKFFWSVNLTAPVYER